MTFVVVEMDWVLVRNLAVYHLLKLFPPIFFSLPDTSMFSPQLTSFDPFFCLTEVTFDSLPRLTKLMFENGVIDELLFLDFPEVCRFPSGLLLLKYGKAVQESVYENFRVVHEGQLHIVFTQDLKVRLFSVRISDHV